ncbi:hypothetical protein MMC22_003524 [Lobaria immixta]|nr:hypothetical protein [Lobaria immixta]
MTLLAPDMNTQLMARQASQPQQHAPYPPTHASLGLTPTVDLDVPITAVFLFLFILGAIAHMTIFQVNKRRGHKFIMSGMMFGFCMARITTCVMRIVWATRPTKVPIAIAAQIFVAAGVVLLFVVNIIFAQRIIRASHPNSGWHPVFSKFFICLYVLIVITLVILITAVVQSFYTLNTNTLRIDHDLQLYGQTLYAVMAFLPFPLVLGGLVIPRRTRVEKFGNGRFRSKIYILLLSAALLTLGAAFRVGINYKTPRPRDHPAWYHSKACFYIFNFTVEWLVIALYVLVRVDTRFFVPDGSRRAGDYSGKNLVAKKISDETLGTTSGTSDEGASGLGRIMSEEAVFDEVPEEDVEHGKEGENGMPERRKNGAIPNGENAV